MGKARLFQLLRCSFIYCICLSTPVLADSKTITVDADYPGGNIVIEKIDGGDLYVHQDLRDTKGDWFYWNFRVRGAEGRTVQVHFTQSNVIGVLGPAVSYDGGRTWRWLGKESVKEKTFTDTVPEKAGDVRYAFTMPYLETNWREFLASYENHPSVRMETLCQSRKGRRVELLFLGRLDGPCEHRVLLTSCHHACEMMAVYSLEGIVKAVLSETEEGRWLREHVEFAIVPFADKDGVEDGDQGKNRIPFDHCRDYDGESIYPEVRAIRERIPAWSQGKLRLAIDMHDPHIRGENNEWIYFVGTQLQDQWKRVMDFSTILEFVRKGSLPFDSKNNLPFGESWNIPENYGPGKCLALWAGELPGIIFGTSIEIPYANASGQAVTPDSARAFGRDMTEALRVYLGKINR